MSINSLQNKTLMQASLSNIFYDDREKSINQKAKNSFQVPKSADESELLFIESKDKPSNVNISSSQFKRTSRFFHRRSSKKTIDLQESYLGNNINIQG